MIHLITRERHAHSGMHTFASGLQQVGGGRVTVVNIAEAHDLRFEPGDTMLFDDHVGPDGGELINRWSNTEVTFAVLIHSPLLQMDVSNELADTIAMLQSARVDLVLAADEGLASLLERLAECPPAMWLPHCVAKVPERGWRSPRRPVDGASTLWMPMTLPDDSRHYRHKNAICQTAAAALCDHPVEIATNTASERLRQTARWLSIPLREVGHVPNEQFDTFLDKMSVGLCVSLAESFCYNAIEMMLRGIPVLFGPTLNWAWRSPELVELCGVADPGSAESIASKLGSLLADSGRYNEAASIGYEVALKTVARNHAVAREVVVRLSEGRLTNAAALHRHV